VACKTLWDGFWSNSISANLEEDQYYKVEENGTIREEFAKGVPSIGCRCDCLPPSFYIGYDKHRGYIVAMHPTDDDLCLFWLVHLFMNSNPNPKHVNNNIGCLCLFSSLKRTSILGGRQNKGIYGVRIRLSPQARHT